MPANEPSAWLRYAEDDLAAARGGLDDRSAFQPRHVCFDAQQAAEKAIKALCLAERIEPTFSHDLARLSQMLPSDRRPRTTVEDLQELTSWATARRYPGDDDAEWPDAERAVAIAAAVVADARAKLPAP